MTWFKVDDSFHSHPKVLATPPAALGLWVVAGAWSSANLTEGYVPDHALPRLLPDATPLARKLVASGLWRRERGGYRFHDWIAYNPTRSEATAARDKMASGGAIGNHRRWHVAKGVTDDRCAYCQHKQDRVPDRPPDQVPDGVPESGANPPTRPDPSRRGAGTRSNSPLVGGAGGKPRERGTRLPDNFAISEAMADWAREHVPRVDIHRETEKFINYWRAKAGRDATKLDWRSTWRNWMLRADEHNPRASPNGQTRPSTRDQRVADALAAGARVQAQLERQQRLEITP